MNRGPLDLIVVCGTCGVQNRTATALLAHGRRERAEGYAAALDAARDAVAALREGCWSPEDNDEALAAIDELREEAK